MYEWNSPDIGKKETIDSRELMMRLQGNPNKSKIVADLMAGKQVKVNEFGATVRDLNADYNHFRNGGGGVKNSGNIKKGDRVRWEGEVVTVTQVSGKKVEIYLPNENAFMIVDVTELKNAKGDNSDCTTCGGDGWVDCSCKGNKPTCTRCDGDGWYYCPKCTGRNNDMKTLENDDEGSVPSYFKKCDSCGEIKDIVWTDKQGKNRCKDCSQKYGRDKRMANSIPMGRASRLAAAKVGTKLWGKKLENAKESTYTFQDQHGETEIVSASSETEAWKKLADSFGMTVDELKDYKIKVVIERQNAPVPCVCGHAQRMHVMGKHECGECDCESYEEDANVALRGKYDPN